MITEETEPSTQRRYAMADRFYRVDLSAGFPDRVTEGSAQSGWGNGWVWGLVLLVPVVGGCTE